MLTAFTTQALSLLFDIEYGETRENPFPLIQEQLSDYQVLESLVCSGIIIPQPDYSSFGVHSYRLARPFSSISLLEVICATGGTIQLVDLTKPSPNYHRERNVEFAKISAIDYTVCQILRDIKISNL